MVKDTYLPYIMNEVGRIRKEYRLNANAPIGDYIFNILEKECILVEWSEDEQLDLDGLSTEKVVNGRLETIVYINSAKSKEKQNFCAAHELGHRHKLDRLIRDDFPDDVILHDDIEDIMNRFAAELMMPEADFRRRSYTYCKAYQQTIKKKKVISFKNILVMTVQLMNFYYMPYKAVVLRFGEIDFFSDDFVNVLLKFEKSSDGRQIVDQIIRQQGITRLRTPDHKTQYSVGIKYEKIKDILEDPDITKYMTTGELRKCLKNMGFTEESSRLIADMKRIEEESIEIDEIKKPEKENN